MNIHLNRSDAVRLRRLIRTWESNTEVLGRYANYLNKHSCFITKELIREITQDCDVSEEYAYFVLLAAATGLDMEGSEWDRSIARSYYLPSIRQLRPEDYWKNPYYRNITIPEIGIGSWELKYESFQPYEALIYDDLLVEADHREIPRLGFFPEEFQFPAVLENGREWMTITPNEIATMQPALDEVNGKVITFGLGLGYFAYMASEKEQVEKLTIIERNEEVIRLFRDYILPQFPHQNKLEIIAMDAFIYARDYLTAEEYDYAFVDLWHDVSDGVELYLRMKRLEVYCPKTRFLYWIEESILSNLRRDVLLVLLKGIGIEDCKDEDGQEITQEHGEGLPEEVLRSVREQEYDKRHGAIAAYLEGLSVSCYEEFVYFLSDSFLKILARELIE